MRQLLDSKDVEFLVVHSTDTNIHQDLSLQDILEYRKKEGYPDIGFHFVIHREGFISDGIPLDRAGTHTNHFDTKSVGILMVGGKTTRGKPSDNYTKEQHAALGMLLMALRYPFPNAVPKGSGELLGGTSPHFSIGEQNDTSTNSNRTPSEEGND